MEANMMIIAKALAAMAAGAATKGAATTQAGAMPTTPPPGTVLVPAPGYGKRGKGGKGGQGSGVGQGGKAGQSGKGSPQSQTGGEAERRRLEEIVEAAIERAIQEGTKRARLEAEVLECPRCGIPCGWCQATPEKRKKTTSPRQKPKRRTRHPNRREGRGEKCPGDG
jgi:hypothetical protein